LRINKHAVEAAFQEVVAGCPSCGPLQRKALPAGQRFFDKTELFADSHARTLWPNQPKNLTTQTNEKNTIQLKKKQKNHTQTKKNTKLNPEKNPPPTLNKKKTKKLKKKACPPQASQVCERIAYPPPPNPSRGEAEDVDGRPDPPVALVISPGVASKTSEILDPYANQVRDRENRTIIISSFTFAS